MKINLNTLNKEIAIDNDFVIPEYYYEKTSIKDILNIHAKGRVFYDLSDEVNLELKVDGTLVLEDAISLENIEYPIHFDIEENISENEEYLQNKKNILDIIDILWENIVLEVPISVTNVKDAHQEGKGWALNGEESEDDIDPRLSKLKDIFKGGE